jgi:hypothetical protein
MWPRNFQLYYIFYFYLHLIDNAVTRPMFYTINSEILISFFVIVSTCRPKQYSDAPSIPSNFQYILN